jgi:predicted NAD/FAD-binding protein
MSRVAIIGTGIAGLGCAHFLHRNFDLELFDGNSHIGGHSNTVTVTEEDREVCIDTGFMVYNEVTYPNLTRLFKILNAPVKKTSMSFSVQHRPSNLEYSGSSVNHLFAQRSNLLRLRFWKMIKKINRFNDEAVQAINDPRTSTQSLQEYVEERGYGSDFLELYLTPMSSAVWSTPPEKILNFPAATLLRFFHNHGFLGLHTQHQWWTVHGGARNYVRLMVEPFRDNIHLRQAVSRVEELRDGIAVTLANGEKRLFDKVILACHADQALSLLAQPDETQRKLLSPFQYESNIATLHTDPNVMPKKKLAWASWNYRIDEIREGETPRASTIYWMNCLQNVSKRENYFLSINGTQNIREERVLKEIRYQHPLFDLNAITAQKELPKLNQRSTDQKVFFCGSYFGHGFHEDAFTAAISVSELILKEPIWT